MAGVVDMDLADPFNPVEATVAGDDEAEGGAVTMGQGLVGDMGG